MFNLLGGGLFTPDTVPLEADRRERCGLETDEIGHFHGQLWRRIHDARQKVWVFDCFGWIRLFACCGARRARHQRVPAIGDARKANSITLLARRSLISTIVRRTRDDDTTHPV